MRKPSLPGKLIALVSIAMAVFVVPVPALALGTWNGWGWSGSGPLTEVSSFGSNPGQLRMFKYVPEGLPPGRPLVVALHGCTQQATGYDDETGWLQLADRHRFAVLFPQETINLGRCFRWFDPAHNRRDQGEALSIRQMIASMTEEHRLNAARVYITGLSAGGAMTAVLLATYPELFAGGAVIAGIPFRCATNEHEAQNSCGLFNRPLAADKDLSPRQWGDLVRNASGHRGPFPPVSLWHGSKDATVNPADLHELMEQWTDVHGVDQAPDLERKVAGHLNRRYHSSDGSVRVETWLVNGMAHGTPVDPGEGDERCGKAAPFILSAGICSSMHILRFWGMDE